eukprot:c23480_g1_i1 orf=380-1483(-)
MAGLRWPLEEGDYVPGRVQSVAEGGRLVEGDIAVAPYSDDDRSIAADSWSVKSEYGSTLDGDDQRHADAECLAASSFRASDYSSDKEEQGIELDQSILGLKGHWDASYAGELTHFFEHGDVGEIWFGEGVMETIALWTARVCAGIASGLPIDPVDGLLISSSGYSDALSETQTAELASWNVLDIGTGNGLLLQAFSKHGFTSLTGIDYSDAAIQLARAVAERNGYPNIKFLVDDILETKLKTQFKLVTDKGTLDAIGLHPEGPLKRNLYWKAVSKLVAPDGVLVITSCNSTKDELVDEASSYLQNSSTGVFYAKGEDSISISSTSSSSSDAEPVFHYIDHIRTYPTFQFGGGEGSRVSTVAFLRLAL